MPDAVITVVDGHAVITPFGYELLEPIVEYASLEAARAETARAASVVQADRAEAAATTAAAYAEKPVWAGKVNGWPDTFFRRFDLTSKSFLGRSRWYQSSGLIGAGWTRVANSEFKGAKALRRAAGYNTTSYSGPYLWLDEVDAAPGDTITVYVLIKDPAAGGGRVYAVGQFSSSNDTVANGVANVFSNAAGNQSGIVADATPRWLRLSIVVPAGAQGVRVYPYTISGATGFDFLACWAFKGAVADGPSWPAQEENYFALRDTEIEGRLGAAELTSSPYVAWASGSGDAEMVGDSVYTAKIIGGRATVAGKTVFDRVQTRVWAANNATAVEWKVWIRDATTPFNMNTTPAAASGTVAGGAFPTANALYTLALGVTLTAGAGRHVFYAFRPVDGTNITQPTWVYDAAVAPARVGLIFKVASDWNNTFDVGNPALTYGQVAPKLIYSAGIDSSLNPRVAAAETDIAALKAASNTAPIFTIPAVVPAIVGTELNLYHDAIFSARSEGLSGLMGYSVSITGPKGQNKKRCFRFTPMSGDVGTHNFTAKARDRAGVVVATRSFSIAVVSASPKGSAKNALMLGDSLTAAGQITATVQAKLAALGATIPTFVGSQGANPAKHEGRGGKTFSFFATAGGIAYRFTVSGVTAVGLGATFTVSGVTYTVTEVNITAGSGTLAATGASPPPASGTLTKSGGTGDATLAFSASATEAGNPVYISGALNVGGYRTAQGIAAVIDLVSILLGINDVFGETLLTSFTGTINYAKAICAAFLADNAACKIVIQLPTLCGNTNDGFAANYGASQSREVFEANIFGLRAALIAAFDAGTYNANVSLGTAGLQVDRYYGYGLSSTAVAARIPAMTDEHINGVHPTTVGYYQIGDAIFADLMAVL